MIIGFVLAIYGERWKFVIASYHRYLCDPPYGGSSACLSGYSAGGSSGGGRRRHSFAMRWRNGGMPTFSIAPGEDVLRGLGDGRLGGRHGIILLLVTFWRGVTSTSRGGNKLDMVTSANLLCCFIPAQRTHYLGTGRLNFAVTATRYKARFTLTIRLVCAVSAKADEIWRVCVGGYYCPLDILPPWQT